MSVNLLSFYLNLPLNHLLLCTFSVKIMNSELKSNHSRKNQEFISLMTFEFIYLYEMCSI
jgi:hypothetical protein